MSAPAQSDPHTAVRYRVSHTTRYEYEAPVTVSHHTHRLRPRPVPWQTVHHWHLGIDPAPSPNAYHEHHDYFGNPTGYLGLQTPHTELTLHAALDVTVRPSPTLLDEAPTPAWDVLAAAVAEDATPATVLPAVHAFTCVSPLVPLIPGLRAFAAPNFPPGQPIGEAVRTLLARIHRDFRFDPTATTVSTPLSDVLENRRGVCQDFAHVMLGCLRSLGLPARYVSGYLRTLPPPGKPRLVGADASHAWVSVWCGGERWLDLCPTNGRVVDADFITLAWGRDYGDVCPVRGVILGGGAAHSLHVAVDVEPISA